MFTLMPRPISSRIAGMPSCVAGTFTITLSRAIDAHSRSASAIVPSVSWARSGDTSIETNPSRRSVSSYTGPNASAASRMSWIASRS